MANTEFISNKSVSRWSWVEISVVLYLFFLFNLGMVIPYLIILDELLASNCFSRQYVKGKDLEEQFSKYGEVIKADRVRGKNFG